MLIGDRSAELRREALELLAQEGSSAATAFIQAAMNDSEVTIRDRATELLARQ